MFAGTEYLPDIGTLVSHVKPLEEDQTARGVHGWVKHVLQWPHVQPRYERSPMPGVQQAHREDIR